MTKSPVRVDRAGGLGRTFNALWSATGTANLGDAMYLMVLPLIALRLTSSAGLVAGVTVVLTLAWPAFGLHAGAVVDRVDRRRLIVAVNVVRALTLGVLTVLLLGDMMSIGWVYLAALVLGVGETLVDTALAALVPPSVDRPENLDRANARLEVAQNVTNQFVGPPLAGLLAIVGLAAVTGVGALLFLATVPLLALMRGSFRARVATPAAEERGGDGVTAGLRFLWRNRLLRNLTLLTAAMNVFWAAWTAVLVVYLVAPGPGHLSTAAYGVLLTTMAAGGIIGAALVVPLRRRLGDHLLLAVDVLGTIVLIGTPAVTTNPFAIGAAMAVGGAGSAVWRVIVGVIRQTVTPTELLGRVYSASRVISWGVLPVGAALGGLIAELWTVRTVFVVGGLASVGLLLAYAVTVRPKDLAS